MSGTLQVGNIIGPTTGADANKVIIPSGQTLEINSWTPPTGTVLQFVQADNYNGVETTVNATNTTVISVSLTRLSANSKFCIMVQAAINRPSSSGWHRMGYKIGSSTIVADVKDATAWHTQSQLFDNESLTDVVGSTMQFYSYNSNAVSQNDRVKNLSIAVWEIAQ